MNVISENRVVILEDLVFKSDEQYSCVSIMRG